MTAILAVCSS